jgi:hypothetical protein
MELGGNVSHVFAQCRFEIFRAYASGLLIHIAGMPEVP